MDIELLYQQALECLNEKQFQRARELGHQLLKLRFSGAYEILAKSFHGEGKLQIATQVLESAVKDAPGVWILWLHLGNYRSEAGDLNAAIDAYTRARALPGADIDQLIFNEAYLRLSFNNKEKALDLFAKVIKETEDKGLRLVALKHRLSTLIETDRVIEALMELGEAYLHEADNAELLSHLAFKLLSHGDRVNALNLAKQSLGLRRAGEVARVLRLIEGQASEACYLYTVSLLGKLEDEGPVLSFKKTSKVFADDEDEAILLARNFEPQDLREELTVVSVECESQPQSEKKGVDWSSEPQFL